MRRHLLLSAGAAALLLFATACGQQTDARVEPTAAEPTAPLQSQIAGATPYITVDCTSLQAMPTDTLPTDATTVGAASAIFQPNGAPAITVATDAQPATELGVADISVGTGPQVQPGETVTANYCGVGLGSKAVFDSSWTRGEPATFPLDGVIAGWQQGVPGMQVGGQRLLVIPSDLGYGDQGTQGIEPGETLVFVVELVAIG